MIRDRLGAIGFTSGFSQDSISITVGEQITVEQLIEKRIIMRLSRHDHVHRHHVQDQQTDSCLHLLLLLHTSTAIQHASSALSSWKNRVMHYARWHDVDKINSHMNKPQLFTLNINDTYMSCPILSLGLRTARSKPLQSTSSHGKINQSSWPNQTNKSEKKAEAILIMHKIFQRKLK